MKGSAFLNPILALLLLGVGAQAARAYPGVQDLPDMLAIDDYLETEMHDAHIPGMALAIVQGDSIVKVRGYGSAGRSEGPVTPRTPFLLGSAEDSFTALAVMQLSEAGSLTLDAPVQRYIPWFRVSDPEASALITPRHLLSHTSGLSTWTGRALGAAADSAGSDPLESQVRALQAARLAHAPGDGFAYSSANYVVLRLLVQTVSGQDYEAYMTEHVLAPLQMQHSFLQFPESLEDAPAVGHRLIFGLPARLDYAQSQTGDASGSLSAGAQDLAHYLVAHLNGGQYGEERILSEEGIAAMQAPQVETGGTLALERYGIGWMAGEMNGIPIIAQRGNLPDYQANLLLMPTEGWGIALLVNANCALGPAKARLDSLIFGVAARLAGSEPPLPQAGGAILWVAVLLAAGVGIMAQISGIARSLAHYRRDRANLQTALRRKRLRLLRVVGPIALPMAVALLILVGAPALLSAPPKVMLLYQPDLAYPLIANGALALLWGALQSVLMAWAIWGPSVEPEPTAAASRAL